MKNKILTSMLATTLFLGGANLAYAQNYEVNEEKMYIQSGINMGVLDGRVGIKMVLFGEYVGLQTALGSKGSEIFHRTDWRINLMNAKKSNRFPYLFSGIMSILDCKEQKCRLGYTIGIGVYKFFNQRKYGFGAELGLDLMNTLMEPLGAEDWEWQKKVIAQLYLTF